MIFTGFIGIVYAFVYAITAVFRVTPIVSLPIQWTNAIATAGGYISALDNFLPVTVLLGILAVFVAYEVAYFAVKFINWIIRKIPMIS